MSITIGPEERQKLMTLIGEGSKVLQEVEDLRTGLNDTVKAIAQELETICPNAVKTEDTGVKRVVTDDLIWHMINSIKELSSKNDALEARLAKLES